MTTPTTRSARARLAASVAELNDMVVFADLAPAEVERLTAAVDQLVTSGARRTPWWHDADPGSSYRSRSPFTGVENPRSPGMRITLSGEPQPRASATVTLTPAFAGPPGAVHGGVLAGLFDELFGALATALVPDRVTVTGRLTTRFRRPTPLRVPVDLRADVARASSRRLVLHASAHTDGVTTAEAEALMVVR